MPRPWPTFTSTTTADLCRHLLSPTSRRSESELLGSQWHACQPERRHVAWTCPLVVATILPVAPEHDLSSPWNVFVSVYPSGNWPLATTCQSPDGRCTNVHVAS